MDYFIIVCDGSKSFIWREYESYKKAENALLGLFNFFYVKNFASWEDALRTAFNSRIYVFECCGDYRVICFEHQNRYYEIVWRIFSKIRGSSLPLPF